MDNISNLPDHLIVHIISSLPTEEAIRTCILSSRWKYLWKGINSICLRASSKTDPDKFANLVDHVLGNCSSTNFLSFELSCRYETGLSRLNELISSALSCKTEKLILDILSCFFYLPPPVLPECILTCSTLVVLELNSCFDFRIPESIVCFPHIKSLDFNVILPNQDKVMHQLLSSCPVLENLFLYGLLDFCKLQKVDICSPTLRELRLYFEYCGKNNRIYSSEYNININTPNLENLFITDRALCRYSTKNLSHVHHVDIGYDGDVNSLLELLKGITATEVLTLSYCTLEVLGSTHSSNWPKFPHLMTLNLVFNILSGWTCVTSLLHTAPNLKVLTLDQVVENGEPDPDLRRQPCIWTPPDGVPTCFLKHLQTIEINWFAANDDELQAVEYFLKNALVLERMTIIFSPYVVDEEAVDKLLMFPTSSESCDVEVYGGFAFCDEVSQVLNA